MGDGNKVRMFLPISLPFLGPLNFLHFPSLSILIVGAIKMICLSFTDLRSVVQLHVPPAGVPGVFPDDKFEGWIPHFQVGVLQEVSVLDLRLCDQCMLLCVFPVKKKNLGQLVFETVKQSFIHVQRNFTKLARTSFCEKSVFSFTYSNC